jgi:hypothetical protein
VGYEKMGHKITDRYHTLGELPFFLVSLLVFIGLLYDCWAVPDLHPGTKRPALDPAT